MARKNTPENTLVHRTAPSLGGRQIGVALVGCGGNGSMMLTRLARLDYALRECGREGLSVVVFDPDIVSRTNVGRQCFSPADVGLHKAAVCVHRINAFYGTTWRAAPMLYPGHIQSMLGGGTMTSPDILISCVDTAKARRTMALQFKSEPATAPRYWLDLGNNRLDGQVVLGQPVECRWNEVEYGTITAQEFQRGGRRKPKPVQARLPVVTELFPEILNSRKRESNAPTCSVAEALDRQSLFCNDSMTVWAAQILDDLLRIGEISYHGVFVNLATGKTNPLPVPVAQAEVMAA